MSAGAAELQEAAFEQDTLRHHPQAYMVWARIFEPDGRLQDLPFEYADQLLEPFFRQYDSEFANRLYLAGDACKLAELEAEVTRLYMEGRTFEDLESIAPRITSIHGTVVKVAGRLKNIINSWAEDRGVDDALGAIIRQLPEYKEELSDKSSAGAQAGAEAVGATVIVINSGAGLSRRRDRGTALEEEVAKNTAKALSAEAALRAATADLDGATADSDSVKDYLKEIGRVPLLNAEQEVELAKRIEAGLFAEEKLAAGVVDSNEVNDLAWIAQDGRSAKNEMLEANLRLVVSVAKKYTGCGLKFLDVIQEGNLGLIRAVEKFDYTKGYKFSTYAMWWIRQAIQRGVANDGKTIRVPVHMLEFISKMGRVERDLHQRHGYEPSVEEVAAEMEVDPVKIKEARKAAMDTVSLQTPMGEKGDVELSDLIEDSEAIEPGEAASFAMMQKQLHMTLDTLSEREKIVLSERFGLSDGNPKTLDEIGRMLGLTRERIRQLEKQALSKMRHPSRARVLEDYLD